MEAREGLAKKVYLEDKTEEYNNVVVRALLKLGTLEAL